MKLDDDVKELWWWLGNITIGMWIGIAISISVLAFFNVDGSSLIAPFLVTSVIFMLLTLFQECINILYLF